MQLSNSDIRTREVLGWDGLHLFHARGSSCSQKLRIVLQLKGIDWQSHEVDLKVGENYEPWYLGINPRGLVPCLVHDGAVHIESNDIIEYLEACFPEPPLIPDGAAENVQQMLRMEDDLHRDLRVLTFRYVIPTKPGALKSAKSLDQLRSHGGTVGGQPDPKKQDEIRFWESANRSGITDAQVIASVLRFAEALDSLDTTLATSDFLLGDGITVLDIAWYAYATRLLAAGYPLHRQHPRVGSWYDALHQRSEFRGEVAMPAALREAGAELQRAQREEGRAIDNLVQPRATA